MSWFDFLSQNIEKYIIFAIATFVQFYIGKDFYTSSLNALKNRIADMNLLIVIGTSVAYFYSVFVLFFPDLFPENMRHLYFESSVAIITFLLIGKYLEEKARNKASSFIRKLLEIKPKKATILVDGKPVEVEASSIVEGDIIILKEGDKVPVDAVVIEGSCEIDNSIITGESLPVLAEKGKKIVSGGIVKSGYCKAKALTSGRQSTINQIIDYILKAQSQKPKISRLADKIVYYFVPSILIISIFVFDIWYIFADNLQNAILASISVLIIACPCALGLATPIAIVSAVGRSARDGILLKNSDAIEIINHVKYILFDKTGTLTEGKLKVSSHNIDKEFLPVVKEIVSKSSHPVSKAIFEFLGNITSSNLVKDFKIETGKGIIASLEDGKSVFIGNERLLKEKKIELPQELKQIKDNFSKEGKLVVFIAVDNKVLGYFILEDKIKTSVKEIINWLKTNGYKVGVISGDTKNSVNFVAEKLGLDFVYGEVLPDEKGKIIEKLKKDGGVLFVGDGINDAPALKISDIGVAVHKGTDLAKEAGDVVLLSDNLKLIKELILLLKFSNKVIKQNLLWAYLYNTIGIPVAGGALYPFFGILLKPIFAGLAMAFSSISVVLNALRIQIKSFK